jgi:hypothetical protein
VQFAPQPLVFADAEDLGDDIRRQAEDAEFARALEDLVNREVAAEDDVATELDLPFNPSDVLPRDFKGGALGYN